MKKGVAKKNLSTNTQGGAAEPCVTEKVLRRGEKGD